MLPVPGFSALEYGRRLQLLNAVSRSSLIALAVAVAAIVSGVLTYLTLPGFTTYNPRPTTMVVLIVIDLSLVLARSEEHTSELQSPDQHSFPTRRSSDLPRLFSARIRATASASQCSFTLITDRARGGCRGHCLGRADLSDTAGIHDLQSAPDDHGRADCDRPVAGTGKIGRAHV